MEPELKDVKRLTHQLKHLNIKVKALKNKLRHEKVCKKKMERYLEMRSDLKDIVLEDLTCIICSEVFMKATIIDCGHTFCEECIEDWISRNSECPICPTKIVNKSRNFTLNDRIESLVIQLFDVKEKKIRGTLEKGRKEMKENREQKMKELLGSDMEDEQEEDSSLSFDDSSELSENMTSIEDMTDTSGDPITSD